MTREELAQRCAAYGAEMSASVVVNLETGRPDKATGRRRRDITVDELLVLALALDVAPVQLMLPFDPPGRDRAMLEVTPDVRVSAWHALLWACGHGERWLPGDGVRDRATRRRDWRDASSPMGLYQRWNNEFAAAARVDRDASDEAREAAMFGLAMVLNEMVRSGIKPPPTPDDWLREMTAGGWLEYGDEVPAQHKEV